MKGLLACLFVTVVMSAILVPLGEAPVESAGASVCPNPHSPIFIDGNADFTPANGVTSGNGTLSNPYIIEGWDIDASAKTGIEIRNTQSHFIIRNVCVRAGSPDYDGIYIEGADNWRLEYSNVSDNRIGIRAGGSNFSIVGNDIFMNEWNGMLVGGINALISSNTISFNTRFWPSYLVGALCLAGSINVTASNNNIFSNFAEGIYLLLVKDVTISSNNIFSNKLEGLVFDGITRTLISNNNFSNGAGIHGEYGASGEASNNFSVSANSFYMNKGLDILFEDDIKDFIISNNKFISDGYIILRAVTRGAIFSNEISSSYIDIDRASDISIWGNNISGDSGLGCSSSNNISITSNNFHKLRYSAISLWDSTNISISDNQISSINSRIGIGLGYKTREISISRNQFINSGIYFSGGHSNASILDYDSHHITPDNLVNGLPILYHKRCAGINLDGVLTGQLIIANCTDVRASNLRIQNTVTGVFLVYVDGATIANLTIQNTNISVWMLYVDGVTIANNIVTNNSRGIYVRYSKNTFVIANEVSSSSGNGIYILRSENVSVYHNSILYNRYQAGDYISNNNSWDNGYPSGGNFWSDYTGVDLFSGPNQDIPGSDDIGDTPHTFDRDSQDRYPLMSPISSNLPPTIDELACTVEHHTAKAWLRIAGEKWHDVQATLYKNGTEVSNVRIVRYPGSPNAQEVFLGTIDRTAVYTVTVLYTPDDDPVNGQPNGATPAWIILRLDDGSEERIHHTFNARHSDTWIWTVNNLESHLATRTVTCTATATDPGMDDLTFEWDFGDGSPVVTSVHFNGGTSPFTATDVQTHTYAKAGVYDVKVRVSDGDGGATELIVTITIP